MIILELIGLLFVLRMIKWLSFDGLDNQHILKEIEMLMLNRNVIAHIFRLPAFDSAMPGCFCIEFIDFVLDNKKLADISILFSRNNS